MHSKSDDIKIVVNDKADEAIEELFNSFFADIKLGLETSTKGSDFGYIDCVTNV